MRLDDYFAQGSGPDFVVPCAYQSVGKVMINERPTTVNY
jgi:hypothetical protein